MRPGRRGMGSNVRMRIGLCRCREEVPRWLVQDAWGRTALHWAAAYACEATVVLLLVRGAHPGPHSHAGEATPPVTPADMAAAAGHAGIAAFLAQQHLLQLLKENNIPLEDPSGGGPGC